MSIPKSYPNKYIDEYVEKYGCVISSVLAVLCIYAVLWQLGDTINGEYSIIYGDLRHIYIPAIKNLCRDILNGESIFYSWNTSFGMNTSLYNAYYAYNPFNILYLVFYNSDDNLITLIIILIKVGMASAFFYSYIKKSHGVRGVWSIVFSLFYSLCSFQIVCNLVNIIWLDALWIMPAVFHGVDSIFEKKKRVKLTLAYTYIFTTEFYIGYMIGIISLIYFVLRLGADGKRKAILDNLKQFMISIVYSVGLSAWVWLPTVFFIINNNPQDATGFAAYKASLLEFFRAFYCRELSGINVQSPNVYCGVITLPLSLFFLISKDVMKKYKVVFGSMYIFMVASCFVSFLYRMWHGFDNPDGWTYRFAYIICFVMCVMAAIAIDKIRRENAKYVILLIIFLGVLYIVDVIYTTSNSVTYNIAVNVTVSILWIVTILCIINADKRWKPFVYVSIVILSIGEILFAYKDQELLVSDTKKNEYLLWNLTEKETVEKLNSDSGLFRVNYLNDIGYNSGTYYGYNGISHFSSAENPLVRNVLSKLGVASSQRIVMNHGLTDVSKMIFDVKYDVIGPLYRQDMTPEDTYAQIYSNDAVLNIGYMVSGNTDDYYLCSNNAFENNNHLLSLMIGEDVNVFQSIDIKEMTVSENGVSLIHNENGYIVETIPQEAGKVNPKLSFNVAYKENVYAYIYHKYPYMQAGGFMLAGGYENTVTYDGKLSLSYIKPLLKGEDESSLMIIPIGNAKRQSFEDIFFAKLNQEELKKVYEKLSPHQLIIREYHDGYIKGVIDAPEDKNVLFTSIPYEKGWSVLINGKEGEILPILNDAFSAIILPLKGENTIEFKFKAKGVELGMSLSLLTLALLILIEMKRFIGFSKQIGRAV